MIFFKAEANSKVGGGHLHRCISIAKECVKQGQEIAFIFAETPNDWQQKVTQLSFPAFKIPKKGELKFDYYRKIIPVGSIILFDTDDSRFYSGELIDSFKDYGVKTACYTITDKYKISTDILINTNIISRTHQYKINAKSTTTLLGPEYMIFNEAFRDKEIKLITKSNRNNLLLFFGNADSNKLTSLFLDILNDLDFKFDKINVVVGGLNPLAKEIEAKVLSLNSLPVYFHYNILNISDLYEETDIAITAAGMTMWEMAVFNIPQMVVASSKREIEYTKYLQKLKFIELLGDYTNLQEPTLMLKSLNYILTSGRIQNLQLDLFRDSIDLYGIKNLTSFLLSNKN